MNDTEDLLRAGLQAWTGGDVDALEQLLHPRVTLRWIEPGDWDCIGRDQVVPFLRQARTGAAPRPMTLERVDENHFVVSLVDPGDDPMSAMATRITVAQGLVTDLQQHRTRAAAWRGEEP